MTFTERAKQWLEQSSRNSLGIAVGVAVLLTAVGGAFNRGFVSPSNLLNLLAISSLLGLAAAGQTLVVLSGGEGIDLSIGAVISLSAVLTSQISNGQNGLLFPAVVVTLVVGALLGLVNGLGIYLAQVPPLIMTLGMSSVIEGIVLVYTQGQPKGQAPPFLATLGTGQVLGIPWLIIVWAVFTLIIWYVLKHMVYGRLLFLVGDNRSAGRMSGVPIAKLVVGTYALSGFFSACTGILFLGYTNTTYLNIGDVYILPSVAAVVVGGTALSGGRGGYIGTVVGAILLTVLDSLLTTMHMGEATRGIINGVVLLVLLSIYTRQPKDA
ncbi:ribose transport system permease protein RbsC [Peptococcaceae bacterium CEB3]|nr:ribose transport system permease protein RbsC [Peptococcaceae bacterium CEB3]